MPSLIGGGAEKVLITLLSNLNQQQYDITLLVISNKGIYFDHIPPGVTLCTLFNNDLLQRGLIHLHRKINLSFLFKYYVNRKIKTEYDIGISFLDGVYSDFLIVLDKKVHKLITVVHSSYKSYINRSKFIAGAYKKRLVRKYHKFDAIVSVSNDALKEFQSMLGSYKRMAVIYNPVEKTQIMVQSRAFEVTFAREQIHLIAVGSLLPVKGYDNLIAACKKLQTDGYRFKLRILGRGFLKTKLEDQIRRAGLSDYVQLLGFKANPYPYIRGSDIFVMSSVAEGLPTVLIEAMVLGLPVLVTGCPGCREIVQGGEYGVMVEQGVHELYQGLRMLMDDKGLREYYHFQSLQRSKDFDKQTSIAHYEQLFHQMLHLPQEV